MLSRILLGAAGLLCLTSCSVLSFSNTCADDGDCPVERQCLAGGCVLRTDLRDAGSGLLDVECEETPDCGAGRYCASNQCVLLPSCTPDLGCPQDLTCWPNDNQCRRESPECRSDAECNDGLFCTLQTCNLETLRCEVVGSPCPLDNPNCQEATESCHPCTENEHCDDDVFCNGPEWCVDYSCVAGNPPCEGDPTFCSENLDRCVECEGDSCNNDNPCDGLERCDSAGDCVDGEPPCKGETPLCIRSDGGVIDESPGSDGGTAGSDAGVPVASLGYQCIGCLIDADCNDGLYCTGEETCVDGDCVSAGNPCEAIGENCLEATLSCGDCQVDTDCTPASFCLGVGTCEDLDCVLTPSCEDPLLPVCYEPGAACVRCELSGDCGPISVADADVDRRAGEFSEQFCWDPDCTGFDCSWSRRCEDDVARPYCGCVDFFQNDCNVTEGEDWECKECNETSQCAGDSVCSSLDGILYNGNLDTQIGTCETCDQSPQSTDPGCTTARPNCLETGERSCKECVVDAHCPNDPLNDECYNTGAFRDYRCHECTAAGDCGDGNFCTIDSCQWDGQDLNCVHENKCNAFGPTPNCNPNVGLCVECLNNGHCNTGDELVCSGGSCVECVNNGDCSGGDVCRTSNNTCVPCLNGGDCSDGDLCTNDVCNNFTCSNPDRCPGEECIAGNGQCVECINNGDCGGVTALCSPDNQCVQCVGSGDCGGATPICSNSVCVECTNNVDCADGDTCTTDTCQGNNTCSNVDACPGQECIAATGQCVECINNGDCNAAEPFCVAATNQCVECTNDAQCPGVCEGGQCVECRDQTQCGDADLCTTDTCEANNTCSNPDACPGEACIAGTGQCVQCIVNGDCGGGTPVCAGDNTCVQCEGNGDCGGGTPVCLNAVCVECDDNGDCNDGDLCTTDTCEANNTCSNPDACPGESCITGTGQCVECIDDGQCGGATPACDNNACVECTGDQHCTMPQTCDVPSKTCTG